ncbi:MAG: hypothetical protein H7257_08545 [Taibaiella sp.]|nr:hypothetical protein [Taibaiella sp.]
MRLSVIFSLFVVCIFQLPFKASAQKDNNNSVVFGFSDYYVNGLTTKREVVHRLPLLMVADQLSVNYERKVYRNFRVGVGFSAWNETDFLNGADGYTVRVRASPDAFTLGGKFLRSSYKMFDACALYRYNKFRKHKVTAGAGVSYCKGKNSYIDSISREQIVFAHDTKESSFGFLATACYDYLFLHGRFGVGPDIKYRNYPSFRFSVVDYGFHVAVHF